MLYVLLLRLMAGVVVSCHQDVVLDVLQDDWAVGAGGDEHESVRVLLYRLYCLLS